MSIASRTFRGCAWSCDTRADRVSVFGLSLGGYFALRLATRRAGPAPAAVVVWYGMYPAGLPLVRDLRSPLLIAQGTRDAPAFVDAAREALGLAGDRAELLLCPGAVHQFDLFQSRSSATRERGIAPRRSSEVRLGMNPMANEPRGVYHIPD